MLRWSSLALVAAPLAACVDGYDDSPDPLARAAAAARRDAEAAAAIDGDSAAQVARVRAAQADALTAEVRRANRPRPSMPPQEDVADLAALGDRLTAARRQARQLLAVAPPHRAGLLASMRAGCAGVQVLHDDFGDVAEPSFDEPSVGPDDADDDAVDALQTAIAAEHAAVWIYGLVSAYLSSDFDDGIEQADVEHRRRRDGVHAVLTALDVQPDVAAPAYDLPEPVDGEDSAMAAVVTAEDDALGAWRGVLERTEHPALREFASDAMQASAVRATRWRREAGSTPAAIALP